jgi:nucleoside-diphosphate-sugar epimerase
MHCLVTGASGFLGSHLVRKLVDEGHEVAALVRASSDLWRIQPVVNHVRFIYSSLADIPTAANAIADFRPDTVFHLAWTGGNSSKFANDDAQIFDNIPGSLNLLRIAHQAGASRFVYLGSTVEYGTYQIPVRETDIPQPFNLYGQAKLAVMRLSEALCAQYGMKFAGVRLFWAYGPMDDKLRMIPSVITKLLNRERPSLTAGTQIWDFLYVEDAVRALLALASCQYDSSIFNLGSGVPVSIRDVVLQIRKQIDPSLEIGFGEVPFAPNQVMHLEADISRLKAATGWVPQTSLQDGIRRTVEWYRSQGEHFDRN